MSQSVNKTAYRLTESAIMLAFAAVLSVIKIVDMPYGGSVTACSMLPLLIIAYRYGTRWGLVTAGTYGLIQLLLGMDNLSYATGFVPVVMILLFDYLVAFLVLGLGGLFRRPGRSQSTSLALAAIVTGVLRYLCHVLTGCTVWAGLSVPTAQAAVYSFSYNATYMLPEIVILVLGAIYLSRFLSFEGATVTRAATQERSETAPFVLSATAKLVALVAAAWIVVVLAPTIQNPDGELFLSGLISADWGTIGLIALCGSWITLLLELLSARLRLRKKDD